MGVLKYLLPHNFSSPLARRNFDPMTIIKHESDQPNQPKIILKSGYLYKGGIPRKRRRFFQLVKTTDDSVILEYSDQDPSDDPKNILKTSRKIVNISQSFAISRKSFSSKACSNNESSFSKYGHVFHIYTWNHCFSYACDNGESLDEWMEAMITAKESSINSLITDSRHAELSFPIRYDHVWQVTVKSVKRESKSKPSVGKNEIFSGVIRICFLYAHKNLYFHKVVSNVKDIYNCLPPSPLPKPLDIQLNHIRKIGHRNNLFSLETGRGAAFGSITLNVAAEDKFTAEFMHETILQAMKPDSTTASTEARRATMHSYQSSPGVLSVGGTISEPDKISFQPINDEYVDCNTLYSTDTLRDRAETLPHRTRNLREETEYTDITIVPLVPLIPQLVHHSTLSDACASSNLTQSPESMLNYDGQSASHGSMNCQDESGYLPMCPTNFASQSFRCSSPSSSSSMRPSRAYSYGSRPHPVRASRTQIPSRSSILSSLNSSLSNASLIEPINELKGKPSCDLINNGNSTANKSTKCSSVPALEQPALRERSSTVGSRPIKKIK